MDDVNLPTLVTDRLVIRPMVPSDATNIKMYGEDPDVAKFLPDRTYSYDENWIAAHPKAFVDRERATFAITLASDQVAAIGLGVIIFDQKYKEVGEIGYWVAKHQWRQGIATGAANKLVEWGFSELNFEVISARCVPENIGSIKVLENLGMTYEGCLRSRSKKGDKFEDLVYYSILRSEYFKRNSQK